MVEGKVEVIEDHMPKAYYIGFTNNPKETFLIRIFAKDVSKFGYDIKSLKGKTIKVKGPVTLYWPNGDASEIIVSKPSQIEVKKTTADKVNEFIKGVFTWK
jgi:NAD(P)H-flavin reductase